MLSSQKKTKLPARFRPIKPPRFYLELAAAPIAAMPQKKLTGATELRRNAVGINA
ncbi:hypothetical protein J43TS9_65580 [Paenibacillus cineris]|nr:hypothetical protein J43TS9_65580 [Paenibacillus cineris]